MHAYTDQEPKGLDVSTLISFLANVGRIIYEEIYYYIIEHLINN